MGRRVRIMSALVAGTLAFVVGTSTAHAILSQVQQKCQFAIGKEASKYVNSKLKLIQKCKDANLANPGDCAAPDPAALTKLETKLLDGIAKKCSFTPGTDDNNLAQMGFPGPCPDPNPLNGFTTSDLQACILDSHNAILAGVCGGGTNIGETCTMLADCPDTGPGTFCRGLVTTEYDPTVVGPISGTRLKCQKEAAKNAGKFLAALLKNVQKCRNDLLKCKLVDDVITCKLTGVTADTCRTLEPKTKIAVDKAETKAIGAITSKCADPADVAALKLCDPDQTTAADAANCIIGVHQDLGDNANPAAVSDLLDYEYATRGVCGDNRQNQVSEECDGIADTACPGQCGDALGNFPCLCQNIPRTRVIEHSNADLDNGWSGLSHDSGVVEGGGYVTDLYDCDGPGGPDTQCVVGPSCNLAPHQPCSPGPNSVSGAAQNADNMCPGVGNFCRITAGGATGPHCEIEFKKRCANDSHCTTPGDRCLIIPHGAPLPLSSGGVSVCVVNEFTEDVVGTTDLATGASSVRLRQNSTTFTGGAQQQPCPVCGGFCAGTGGDFGPIERTLCTTDDDCPATSFCVTQNICSWGPDRDKPCRPDTPFGGPTEFFGNPSKDCRMAGNFLGTIDILFNPATTATVTKTANISCARTGYNNKVCAGGPNQHVPCTVDSECPGGTCNFQCFCGTSNTVLTPASQQPNQCGNACLNGPDDGSTCASNADCTPPGFCHIGDCRDNSPPNGPDTDSAQEGICTSGPADGHCSVNTFVNCNVLAGNNGCRVAGGCPFCVQDSCSGGSNDGATCTNNSACPGGTCTGGETCNAETRQCFVNPTILREGLPGTPDRTTASIFCIASTGAPAVDSVAGLPGPGAITQPTTTEEVGF